MFRSGFLPPLTSSLVKPVTYAPPVAVPTPVQPTGPATTLVPPTTTGFSGPVAATTINPLPLTQSIVNATPQVIPSNGVLGNPVQPTTPVVANLPATGGMIGPVHATTAVSTTPITTTLPADLPAVNFPGLVGSQFVGATAPVNGAAQIVGSRFEYIPIERSVVEMEQVKRFEQVPKYRQVVEYDNIETTEYIPHEKKFTDYQAVEYITEQIPYTYQESYIDYVPQEKIVNRIGFNQVERTVNHPVVAGSETQIVHPAVDAVQSVTPAVRQVPVEVPPAQQAASATVFRSPLTSSLVGTTAVVQPVAAQTFVPSVATQAFVPTTNFVQPAFVQQPVVSSVVGGRPLTVSQQIVPPAFY